jgi:hypothetical protein
MDKPTLEPHQSDRRNADRRTQPAAAHTGPDRRVGERRSGKDRRRQPRIHCPLPDDFE